MSGFMGIRMTDPLLFCLSVAIILATPGPTNTLLATSGATIGWRASLPLVPAELAGYLIAILAIGILLHPILTAWPDIGTGLSIVVGLYLAWIAWKLWQSGGVVHETGQVISPRRLFIATLLNPKALVFAHGIVPLADPAAVLYLAGFSTILILTGFGWISLGAMAGGTAGAARRPRLVPRFGAAVLSIFSVIMIGSPLIGLI